MNYILEINNRPWQAIRYGTKEIEIRTNTEDNNLDYSQVKQGDTFTLMNNSTLEQFNVKVLRVSHYNTIRELLEKEGTKKTLSSGKDIEGGIESINSLNGYKEGIKKNGVWALKIKPVKNINLAEI